MIFFSGMLRFTFQSLHPYLNISQLHGCHSFLTFTFWSVPFLLVCGLWSRRSTMKESLVRKHVFLLFIVLLISLSVSRLSLLHAIFWICILQHFTRLIEIHCIVVSVYDWSNDWFFMILIVVCGWFAFESLRNKICFARRKCYMHCVCICC